MGVFDVSEVIPANCGYQVTERIMRFNGTASRYVCVATVIDGHQEHGFRSTCDRSFGVTRA